jgi:hypothetical protein
MLDSPYVRRVAISLQLLGLRAIGVQHELDADGSFTPLLQKICCYL